MPLIHLRVSAPVNPMQRESLLKELSKTASQCLKKPEQYVMVVLEEAAIMLAGKTVHGCFADVKGIGGINGRNNKTLAEALCTVLKNNLGIQPENVYINFTDVAAENWGFNASTFG